MVRNASHADLGKESFQRHLRLHPAANAALVVILLVLNHFNGGNKHIIAVSTLEHVYKNSIACFIAAVANNGIIGFAEDKVCFLDLGL